MGCGNTPPGQVTPSDREEAPMDSTPLRPSWWDDQTAAAKQAREALASYSAWAIRSLEEVERLHNQFALVHREREQVEGDYPRSDDPATQIMHGAQGISDQLRGYLRALTMYSNGVWPRVPDPQEELDDNYRCPVSMSVGGRVVVVSIDSTGSPQAEVVPLATVPLD